MIGNLDDRGYLAQTPSDVALQTGLPYDTVLEALKLLQSFDPPGIGSQNLAECLLAQLRAKGRGDTLAARMLRDHFELLSRRRIPELSRKLGAAADDVQAAIEEIGKLDPAPGRRFAEDNNRVVVPDVVVEKDGDEWKIQLNSDSIEQRQRTIERITREIIKAQTAFFEQGVSQLRPLTMTQIADIVGVHETTVSRAIANK